VILQSHTLRARQSNPQLMGRKMLALDDDARHTFAPTSRRDWEPESA